MLTFIKYLIQLIIAPVNGWEDISGDGEKSRHIALRGLSAVLVVVALSSFTALFYKHDVGVVQVVQSAIIIYVLYWVTFFFADFMFTTFLPRITDAPAEEGRVKTYIAYNVAVLSLVTLVTNLLPFTFALIQLLPIYVGIIMWRGTDYLGVPAPVAGKFMILAVATVLIPPVLIGMLFEIVL